MAVAEFGSITGYFQRWKSGQTRILSIGEVGDKTGGDRPREHCIYFLFIILTFFFTHRDRKHSTFNAAVILYIAVIIII